MLSARLLAASARPLVRPSLFLHSAVPPPHLRVVRTFATSAHRYAANPVSREPGSDNLKHMGENAAEEARGVARTVAEAIAGEANDITSQRAERENFGVGDVGADLKSIQSTLTQVPREVITWGAAGLLPYAGTSLGIVYFARQAWLANEYGAEAGYDAAAAQALLEHAELLQIQYGAIILSFLGAVHWGFEWAKYGGVKGNQRYLLGVVPVLAGWGSLLIPGSMALVTQWGAFFAQWYADQNVTSKGWAPKWYSTYRFWLTSIVGGSILASLAASNYYGSSAEFAKRESQLEKLREGKPPAGNPVGTSAELGDIKAEKASDAYVKFTNVEKEQEKKEEEARKAKEEEQQRKKDEEEAKKQAEKQSRAEAAVKKGKAALSEQISKIDK